MSSWSRGGRGLSWELCAGMPCPLLSTGQLGRGCDHEVGMITTPFLCRTNKLGMFTNAEFEQLAPVLDGFSLMTYDYSTAQP